MKEISLTANPREGSGKGNSRRNRQEGVIPAVIYGPELKEPLNVTVAERDFRAAMRAASGTSSLFSVTVNGTNRKAILREVQRHKVTSRVLHVDFHAVSMTKPLHIKVAIHFVGTPVGVKTDGGIMQTTRREIEVSCLPTKIPEYVEVDVSNLKIGDSIHVRDVQIPDATILEDAATTLVVVTAPTIIKVETPAEAVAADAAAVPGAAPAAGAVPATAQKAPAGDEKAAAPEKGKEAPKKK